MQLKIITDYAIRALIYLADKTGYIPLREMTEVLCVNSASMIKTMRKLRDTGWVDSIDGSAGGYRLIADPAAISLLDVMRVTEDTIRFNRCLEDDGFCSRDATDYCPVHKIYVEYQARTEQYFGSITIQSLL